MVSPEFDPYEEEYFSEHGTIGCYECEAGWRHGCMDDLCRACEPASVCEDARPCRCNPDCEVW